MSTMNQSAMILKSFEDTPGSWRNVAPCVQSAIKSAISGNQENHQMIEVLERRLAAFESKIEELISTVTAVVGQFTRYDVRMDDFERKITKGLNTADARVQRAQEAFSDDILHSMKENRTAVANLAAYVRKLESRISNSIDVQDEVFALSHEKVDNASFNRAIQNLKTRVDELQTPANLVPIGAGSLVQGSSASSSSPGSSRWLWDGGSFTSMGKAIPWGQQISSCSDIYWNPQSASTIKVKKSGIYKISIGVFNDAADTTIPSVGVYIDNDAVVNATNCSTYMLKARKGGKARAARACDCLPMCVNGLTVTDYFFVPADAILAISYRADPRNVVKAFLEVEPFV